MLWLTGRRPTPTRAASQQASRSTTSCVRDTHQTLCGMSQVRTLAQSSFGSLSKVRLLMQQQMRLLPGYVVREAHRPRGLGAHACRVSLSDFQLTHKFLPLS
eukprot:5692851-Pleurochrysis_carterae.AAC.5